MVVGIKIITFAEINNPARRHSPPCPYQEDRGRNVQQWAVEKIRANKYHRRMGRRSLNTGGTPCHRLNGNTIWESALEAHVLARYIVPGLIPLGRESALEAHGMTHTY